MELIVSLPGNELELALASERGGADSVKTHMNVSHRASGLSFGGFSEEALRIRSIISGCCVKVGLMPGQETLPTLEEVRSLISSGLDFVDIYAHHLPPSFLALGTNARLIPAIDHTYSIFDAASLSKLVVSGKPAASMLEASIVHPDYYGTPLSARDLAAYASIVKASRVPVLVPTQKFIKPEDIPALADVGVSALMIGVIVTGPTPRGIEKVTAEFRQAIKSLRPG